MHILWTIVIGFVAGVIAMLIHPGPNEPSGFILTTLLGIAAISFKDSNGDGKGDLPGLISRIDHLTWLGVGAVWLTPVFTSPMLDFGYDIADFCAIDPVFGSLEDFDRLVEALHARDIRL